MSYLPDFVRKEIVPGVTGVDLDWSNVGAIGLPRLKPTLMIYDKDQAYQKGPKKLEASFGSSFADKGVYILFDSQQTQGGKYNVRVGLSGVDGELTLFGRLKQHVSNPPEKMKNWDKAVAICDWKNDIPIEIIAKTKSKRKETEKENDDLIEKRMGEEAKFLEKKLNKIMGTIPTLIARGKDQRSISIVDPDSQRYNLYILYILELLNSEIGFTDKSATYRLGRSSSGIKNLMARGKLAIGEKLSGKFDSQATLINIDGSICVEKYRKNNKIVTRSTDSGLKVISSNQACNIILEENKKATTVSSMQFWQVERNGDRIKLSSL